MSLSDYMELPVEQYHELDPRMIRPLGGNRFALTVPRVNVCSLLTLVSMLKHPLHALRL